MNLKEALKKRGISQTQLTQYVGCSKSTVSHYCTLGTSDWKKGRYGYKIMRFFKEFDDGKIEPIGITPRYPKRTKKKANVIRRPKGVVQDKAETLSGTSYTFKSLVLAVLRIPCDSDTKVLLLEELCKKDT